MDKGKTSRSHEIDDKRLHKELGSSDRSGKPDKVSENIRVKHAHDGTGEPVESSSSSAHIVKEQFVPEEHRDIESFNTDNELNRAINEENIDFNIPGVPNSTVKRSHGDQEYHTANQLQKKCKKRQFLSIHDRFIRDTWFRKTMIDFGRTEEVIRVMDKLANEDHTHIATEEELNVYRSSWWIRSNFVGSDTMPLRHRPDFKEALSTLRRLKNAEDQA